MFGWIKRASQKTAKFNIGLATKALIEICNRGFSASGGEPSKLPPDLAQKIASARDHLTKEVQVAANVDISLAAALDEIEAAMNASQMSPLADLVLADLVANI